MAKAKPRESGGGEPNPYFFVSYSTREEHVQLLLTRLHVAFSTRFEMKVTPSALESGSGQRDQIVSLVSKCAFAVIVLDGLRPNVVFEYGIATGKDRPVLLLKEERATIDVRGFLDDVASVSIADPNRHSILRRQGRELRHLVS